MSLSFFLKVFDLLFFFDLVLGVIAAHWSHLLREMDVADPSLTHVVARNIVITILWLRSDDDAHLCDDDERLGKATGSMIKDKLEILRSYGSAEVRVRAVKQGNVAWKAALIVSGVKPGNEHAADEKEVEKEGPKSGDLVGYRAARGRYATKKQVL